MSYFNEKIYNIKNLPEERKDFVIGMCCGLIETLNEFDTMFEYEEKSTLSKLKEEIVKEAVDEMKLQVLSSIIQDIVVYIDRDEKEVEEQPEAKDHFYGLNKEMRNLLGLDDE